MLRFLPATILLGACAAPGGPSGESAAPRPGIEASAPGGWNPAAQDRLPGRRTLSPGGAWEAVVAEGGALSVRPAGRFGAEMAIDELVDPRVAMTPGSLVYARQGGLVETDLWRVSLPNGAPVQITAWNGSEDRPVHSPDGRRVAFISGRTGIASWWVVDLPGPDGLPVPEASGRQVTNVGVTRGRPGKAPPGFVPPPDGTTYAWTDAGLTWVAEGLAYTAVVP
ncbi:MAG: hypothetical protein Q8P18_18850 [Pseudomonadota bacterium]|nr:hypothetical protein [Pseudomonadota bacterium]